MPPKVKKQKTSGDTSENVLRAETKTERKPGPGDKAPPASSEAVKPLTERQKRKKRTNEQIIADQRRIYRSLYGDDPSTYLKHCPHCKQDKPLLTAFRVDRATDDGRAGLCKEARKAAAKREPKRKAVKRNTARTTEELAADWTRLHPDGYKQCTGPCKRKLEVTQFYRKAESDDGKAFQCRDCINKRIAESAKRKRQEENDTEASGSDSDSDSSEDRDTNSTA